MFTIYQGQHLPVTTVRDNDIDCILNWLGKTCPLPGFEKSIHQPDLYVRIVPADTIAYLYEVKTFGTYKNFTFQVFDHPPDPGKVFIGIKNADALRQLQLYGDQNWAFTEIATDQLEAIWETRTPIGNKKMPEGVELQKRIKN
ncbi:MAG: hypothetical protein NTW29_07680 [Bacteroidetes bacterium]|nr:hypothetical protein [Bacteroidota bacterium]